MKPLTKAVNALPKFVQRILIVLVLVIFGALFVYFFIQERTQDRQFFSLKSVHERIASRVPQVQGEPLLIVVSDISDIERRVHPEFYEQAQNGDWILAYSNYFLLYRPLSDRVISIFEIK